MNVSIGMNMLLWGTNIGLKHIPVFEGLAGAGFDGVELPIAGQEEYVLKRMGRACEDLGLERTASAFVLEDANPISPDPKSRALALERLKRSIDGACLVGADILIGGLYQSHKYFTGQPATEQEWEWSAQYLRDAGEYAASLDLKLGLECLNRFEVFLVTTSADGRRMAETVGLENVGVHYDTHHANIEDPSPEEALAHIAQCVNHIHLSESHRGTLGTGQVDWQGTFDGLKAIDYEGWLVIEAFGTADKALAAAANVWRTAFDTPEQLYRDGIAFIKQHL